MSDFTPSQARVAVDYCNARMSRNPDVTMEEADAEFDRMIEEVLQERMTLQRKEPGS